MKKNIAIEVQNLSKKYTIGKKEKYLTLRDQMASIPAKIFNKSKSSEFWALKNISFEIKKGEVVGIIGKNGAGKSTLLKILSRIVEPTEGKITMRGKVASLLEIGTGFSPELTGRENIYLSGAIIGMTKKEINEKFESIVEFSDIEKFIDTPVKRYSSGMYVRLAFAVAAHLDSDILLVDEVLAVGDVEFQKKCLGKMSNLSKSGRTVIFVSHNLSATKSLCDRVILLEKGKIIVDKPTKEAIDIYIDEKRVGNYKVTWNGKESPHNNGLKLSSVEIVDSSGKTKKEIRSDEPIIINVNYATLKDGVFAGLSISLMDNYGKPIFGSINNHEKKWYGKPMPKGKYQSTCEIPANFLNSGWFDISVNIFGKGFSDQKMIHEALSIEVIDSNFIRKGYLGKYGGSIRPLLEWKTTKGVK